MTHRWHFFRAGGVDQVSLRDGKDILALPELDQKLWVALSMPVKGTSLDPATLTMLDPDGDGFIRVPDILETTGWIKRTFKNPDDILKASTEVELSAIADAKIVAAAKQMLKDLGKADATAISVADTNAITTAFADTKLNGDGIVIPASADDADLAKVIEDVIATIGSVTDRSGKPGIDAARADEFWKAVDERIAWLRKGKDAPLLTLGEATDAASTAFLAVRAKLEDYFTRCRVAAFDPRGAAVLSGQDDALVALASRSLSMADDELAKLPLSKIEPAGRLSLSAGLNPAWAAKLEAFVAATVTPILGARDHLLAADLQAITDKLAPYNAWRTAEVKTKVDALDAVWLEKLAGPELRDKLKSLIARDAELEDAYAQITSVAKAVRMQRDGGRLLRNFVNFSDFYVQKDAVFQAGTLYFDARALHLCVYVEDAAEHAKLAASADTCIAYCALTRKGEKRTIAAAITNGDSEFVFVGRNGIFYDRDGNDWNASVTKIISNPISIREAFWSPYKKLVKMIEETVSKRAAAADEEATAKVQTVGAAVAHADKAAVTPPATPGAPAAAAAAAPAAPIVGKKLDLGSIALIGVAIGGIASLIGAVFAALFGLGKWLPLGILGILLLISGPAMLLAWLKLRRRNLGPILDANGWAINSRARVNVAFGAALTELPRLPKGSSRTLADPYADRKPPWKRWVFLVVVILLAGSWYIGELDKYLPQRVRSTEVLGEHAPAAKKALSEAPVAPVAPAAAPAATPTP